MSKATQFKRTPDGVKTPRMLEVEEHIGRSLEEDYRLHYLDGDYGQKKLANRWGVQRKLIFGRLRGGRRNWVKMLGLRTKTKSTSSPRSTTQRCELCSASDVPLERAHWTPVSERGRGGSNNIVLLCRNCHGKLDLVGDEKTIESVRAILLAREARKFLEQGRPAPEFLALCRQIINARSA